MSSKVLVLIWVSAVAGVFMVSPWLPCNLFLMAELIAQPSLPERSNPFVGLFPSHPLMLLNPTGTEHPRSCPNITCWMPIPQPVPESLREQASQWLHTLCCFSHSTRRPLSDAKCMYISIPVGFGSVFLINPPYCALAETAEWPGLLQLHPFLQDAFKAEEMCHECTYCNPAANRTRKSQAPQSQGGVDANSVVFDRASPCRVLADTHHSNSTALVWYNHQEHHPAVTIFTVSNQAMLQFIHKLLMLSKQALGSATFLLILAFLCTALVVWVGLLTYEQCVPSSTTFQILLG